ncbi:hypothetical protein ACIBCM_18815 [Streptomyces sp. NPDC051018]|uniref:hypothetical protein n=1 Tax=Streptomyces sp. NPDC051018 TaxID=3365639 RepID=UPI0037BAEEAB
MSRLACTIHARGGRAFVKGTPLNDPQAWVYRHEVQVTRLAPHAPHVLWEVDAGGWLLCGYEFIEGFHPQLTPGSGDIGPLVRTLTIMSEVHWPEALRKKPLHTRWAEFLPTHVPSGFQGQGLAHTDVSLHNMLMTSADELLLLDWALACPAPSWADAALTVPRLISAGHTPEQAEKIARQVPAYRDADSDTVTAFARTVYAAWENWERTRPLPHRAALTAAAREWAAHRRSVPFP